MANPFTMEKNYEDATLLLNADLDAMTDSLATFLNDTQLNDDNIQDRGLDGATQIAPASITVTEMASDSVSEAKLAEDSVATAKIAALAATTAKFDDASVTRVKFAALGEQTDSDTATVSGGTETSISSVSVTTGGRSVYVTLQPGQYSNGSNSYLAESVSHGNSSSSGTGPTDLRFVMRLYRDATLIYESTTGAYTNAPQAAFTGERRVRIPVTAVQMVDSPASGTYTYTLKIQNTDTTYNTTYRGRLVAFLL